MKYKFLSAVLLLATPMFGADAAGATLWTTGQFASIAKDLAAKMGEKKSGMVQLMKEKDFNAIVFYREESGSAEIHDTLAEFLIVRSGEGAVLVGGTAVNPKPTGPGEKRGDRVEGGTKYTLSAGDVLYIPANTPHQVLVDRGKLLNVMVVKMEVQK